MGILEIPKATLPVDGKSNEGRTTNGPDSSEVKVWVTPATRPAEVAAEGVERVVKDSSCKQQLHLRDQLQK